MDMEQYQNAAFRTCGDSHIGVLALGLCGESGEVADLVKKHLGHGHDLDKEKIKEELGDVLWYIASMCHCLGMDLKDVAAKNVEKLMIRYPNGFDTERSKNREK